jgi:hypothetical protein
MKFNTSLPLPNYWKGPIVCNFGHSAQRTPVFWENPDGFATSIPANTCIAKTVAAGEKAVRI